MLRELLHRRRLIQGSAPTNITFETTSNNSLIENTYSGVKRGVEVSDSGHRLYVTLRNPDRVTQWEMTTPGDISTLVELSGTLEGQLSDPRGIRLSPDGTKLYYGRGGIREFNLTTPFDVSTAVDTGRYLNTKYTVSGFDISHDGTKVYVTDLNNHVVQYTLDTPWEITPATLDPTEIFVYAEDSTTGELTATDGLCDELMFFNKGKIMIVVDRLTTYGAFNIYKTTTPYVINSYVLDERLGNLGSVQNNNVDTMANAKEIEKVFNTSTSTSYSLT